MSASLICLCGDALSCDTKRDALDRLQAHIQQVHGLQLTQRELETIVLPLVVWAKSKTS